MLNAEVLYNEGLAFENEGKLEEAFSKYELAAALNSADSMVAIARLYAGSLGAGQRKKHSLRT